MAHGKVYSFRRKTLSIPCILSILIYFFPESSLCSWKIYSGMMIKVMIIVHFFPFSSIPRTITCTYTCQLQWLLQFIPFGVSLRWLLVMTPSMIPLVFFFGVSFRWFLRWLCWSFLYFDGVSLPLFFLVSPLLYSVGVSLLLFLLSHL